MRDFIGADDFTVEQNKRGFCDQKVTISTRGLGPCIGVCIAWNNCAAILHSADIASDETDVIKDMLEEVKSKLPAGALSEIQPILCGGDLYNELEDNSSQDVIRNRALIIKILNDEGFGAPIICWNDKYQTVSLFADLKKGKVTIEDHNSGRILRSFFIWFWPSPA
jgi:hypothetical protein